MFCTLLVFRQLRIYVLSNPLSRHCHRYYFVVPQPSPNRKFISNKLCPWKFSTAF
eukprot:UN17777